MKKLDKATLAQRDQIMEKLQISYMDLEAAVSGYNDNMGAAWTELEAAIEAFNTKLDEEWGGLEPMIEDYNSLIADANSWRQDVVNEISEYIENRSEKWQESEAAGRYTSWRDEFDHEFSTFDAERPDELSVDAPDQVEFEMDDVADLLEQLPVELGD